MKFRSASWWNLICFGLCLAGGIAIFVLGFEENQEIKNGNGEYKEEQCWIYFAEELDSTCSGTGDNKWTRYNEYKYYATIEQCGANITLISDEWCGDNVQEIDQYHTCYVENDESCWNVDKSFTFVKPNENRPTFFLMMIGSIIGICCCCCLIGSVYHWDNPDSFLVNGCNMLRKGC